MLCICACVVYVCYVCVVYVCTMSYSMRSSYELNCHQSFFSPFFWKHTMHSCVTCMLSYMNTVQWTIGMDTVQLTIVYSPQSLPHHTIDTANMCCKSIFYQVATCNEELSLNLFKRTMSFNLLKRTMSFNLLKRIVFLTCLGNCDP